MSTKEAVKNIDPNEVGDFDPQLSKEANKKTAPEEKKKEVKEEAKTHVENDAMLATLVGRNLAKSKVDNPVKTPEVKTKEVPKLK